MTTDHPEAPINAGEWIKTQFDALDGPRQRALMLVMAQLRGLDRNGPHRVPISKKSVDDYIGPTGLTEPAPWRLGNQRSIQIRIGLESGLVEVIDDDDTPGSVETTPDDSNAHALMSDTEAARALNRHTTRAPAQRSEGDDMLGPVAMAQRLHTSRQTIANRYQTRAIIGLTREVGGRVYPLTQFTDPGAGMGLRWLHGLAPVVDSLGNGWPAWIWLTSTRDDLDARTPLACLHDGDAAAVERALARDHEDEFN